MTDSTVTTQPVRLAELVATLSLATGWRWSDNVKPIAGTESCEFPHLGYVLSGRMRIVLDDGTTGEVAGGDVFFIPPGHDAEVVGDEPCVMFDFAEEDADYARRK